jgi:hypothetical protein
MRKFRLSRPAVSSERTLDRRGSSFHKCEPFMARWRSIAEEKSARGSEFCLSRLEGNSDVHAQSGCRANLRELMRPLSPLLLLLLSHSTPGCKTRRLQFMEVAGFP